MTSTADQPDLNARGAAIALVAGGISLSALATQSHSLAPIRLFVLGVIAFGVWAFCDEMGVRKPLVRAGFVAFVLSMFARSVAIIEVHSDSIGRYYLLYAFALLIAMLSWSVAYLHRRRELKIAGALGALASIAPIIALIVGHIALGRGAVLGIGSLLAAAEGAAMNDFSAIDTIDYMFSIWAFATAWFLWSGRINSQGA